MVLAPSSRLVVCPGARVTGLNTPTRSRDNDAGHMGDFRVFFLLSRSRVKTRHIFVVDSAAILGRLSSSLSVPLQAAQKKHTKKTERTNVGRHAVKYGPAGRQTTPHVD